jgi:hypothetical protein
MSKSLQPDDEPVILPLRPEDHRNPPEPDKPPSPGENDEKTDTETEEFWAGRSLAMRRSARQAA